MASGPLPPLSGSHTAPRSQIFDHTERCFGIFQRFLEIGDERYHDFVRQLQDRLATWNRYSGASAKPGYRLDDRLSGFDTITEAFVALLTVIVDNMAYACTTFVTKRDGTDKNLSDISSSLPKESGIIFEQTSIKDTFEQTGGKPWGEIILAISELLSLTRTVRESSISNREAPVPVHYQRKDSDFFEQTCRILTRARFPDARSTLTDQLSKSITIRRNRLLYRRDHEEKLQRGDDEQDTILEPEPVATKSIQEQSSRAPRHLGSVPEHGEASGMHSASKLQQPPTLLSKPRQSLAIRPRRELKTTGSVFGRSNRMEEDLKAMYPDKPKPSSGDRSHGICPYCFVPQPLPISDDNWRAHIDKDLQVYICLSEHCADNIKFFDRSDAWLNHMRQEHDTKQAQSDKQVHDATWIQNIHLGLWFCNLEHEDGNEEPIFSNIMEFDLHLREVHKLETRTVDMYRRRKRRRGDLREPGLCPLCEKKPESGVQLMGHIASHLRSLAMLSLPGFDKDVDEEDDPVSIDPMSQPSRKRSSHAAADQTQGADLSDETPSGDLLAHEKDLLSSIVSFEDSSDELFHRLLQEKTQRFSEESDEILAHFQERFDALLQPEQQLQSRKIFDWPPPPDPRTNHEAARKCHEPLTNIWLLQSSQYLNWKSGPASILWVHGKAGCGKTILCSTVIEDIKVHCQSVAHTGYAFFYFTFSDSAKQSLRDLLRSLVAQFLYVNGEFLTIRQHYSPEPEELERLLVKLLSCFDSTFLLLDALDESTEANDLLRLLERLVKGSNKLRIFVTSRETPDIRDSMQTLGARECNAPTSAVDVDIRTYISGELSTDHRLTRLDMDTKALVTDVLTNGANGMFRWVYCQLQEIKKLKSTRPKYIEQVLRNLPKTLDETYERILGGIDASDRQKAVSSLRWVVYALEPLLVRQLCEASTIDPTGDGKVDKKTTVTPDDILGLLSDFVITRVESDETIEVHQNPVVEAFQPSDGDRQRSGVTETDRYFRRVRLAHFSVSEYLESTRILHGQASHFHLEPLREHAFLAESCLTYLFHYFNSSDATSTSTSPDQNSYPLLEYAAMYWYRHALESASYECPSLTKKIMQLLSNVETITSWLMIHWPDHSEGDPFEVVIGGGIYWASYLGLIDVVRELIDDRVDVNGGEGHAGTALHAAACKGYNEIVVMLLGAGANVNINAGPFCTALQAASACGSEDIVTTLLERGAEVNAKGGKFGDALQAAICAKSPYIVERLIDAGAAMDMTGTETSLLQLASKVGDARTIETVIRKGHFNVTTHYEGFGKALLDAAKYGRLEAVRALIAAGVDVNYSLGDADPPALYTASMRGDLEIVHALLDAGADVNTNLGEFGNVLNVALERGHLQVARVLIDAGADSYASMHFLPFGLCEAAERGEEEMVKMFIRFGADANTAAKMETPLELAAESGNAKIVRMLLLAGAQVDGATEQPALMRASASGNEEIVEILLQSGADVNFMSYDATTALKTAAARGHDRAVVMLLEAGARIDSTLNDTALMGAAMGGHDKVVKALLTGGARPNNPGSQNALREAASRGHETIVQMLLSAGADVDGTANSRSPLRAAADAGDARVVKALLKARADVRDVTHDGFTALTSAAMHGHGNMVEILLATGNVDVNQVTANGSTALFLAAEQGYSDLSAMLLDAGADIDHANSEGSTPLQAAAENGHEQVVATLLEIGRNDVSTTSGAICAAAKGGHVAVLEKLLQITPPADLETLAEDRGEALRQAARFGHEEIVQMLIDSGVEVDATGSNGETALQLATESGHEPVVQLLLRHSAHRDMMRHWFIPGDGIDQDVIDSEIRRYFGPHATVRPGVGTDEYDGVWGYWIKAYRNLTPAMIAELREESQRTMRTMLLGRDHV